MVKISLGRTKQLPWIFTVSAQNFLHAYFEGVPKIFGAIRGEISSTLPFQRREGK